MWTRRFPAVLKFLKSCQLQKAAPAKLVLSTGMATTALSWQELEELGGKVGTADLVNGPTSSQARLRLFGGREEEVRVTLYRDHHAWCPYCQKVGDRVGLVIPV